MSTFVPPDDDGFPPRTPRDPEQTTLVISVDDLLQVAINTILATFYFVITVLLRFATNSLPDSLDDILSALAEEPSHLEQHPQDPGESHLTGVPQIIITAIRAADLTHGLRRIPAGFHVVVKTGGAECRTSNKPVHVDQATVEWNERILLPCELSSIVRVSVYASFELGPMLCHGEVLRTFEISVGELQHHSENSHPIIFQPEKEEVVSPCTSLFVTVEQRSSDENDAVVLCPITIPASVDTDALLLETDAGHGLLARYCRTQTSEDLDQSIKHFEGALRLCPMGHSCRAAAEFNLASAKFASFQANGIYLDLAISISIFQHTLDLRPTGHPDRPITQLHLAIALLTLFTKRGNQAASDAAEELLGEVLHVCHANSHIYRAALFAFETSTLYPARSTDENNPGQEQLAASMLPLSPNQLSHRVAQCLQRDDPHDLDEVILLHYDALGYYNTMHARRGQVLCNLGILLQTRFQRQGNSQDVDEAVALLKRTLTLYPPSHPKRFVVLNSLANGLSIRFGHQGNSQDLDDAIALHTEALAFVPIGNSNRYGPLHNLANQLSIRFEHQSNDQDLDLAIALSREALALLPTDHLNRSKSLNNLANQLSTRFEHRGNIQDLDDALALHKEALALRPVGCPDRSTSLNNLANQFSIRFKYGGNAEDLDQAISLYSEALALCPVGRPARTMSLNNLANKLSARFKRRGDDQDLDQAIVLHREALALRPASDPNRSKSLHNLANSLSTRSRQRGNDQDLDEAIALHREALVLRPVGHSDRSKSLNCLANRLSNRFEDRGNDQDLDEAIALHRATLALTPVGHSDRSGSLNNLAYGLSTRFKHHYNDQDFDESIAFHKEALTLRGVNHPFRPESLHNLAFALYTFFQHRRNKEALYESRDNLHCALTLLTQHDPRQLEVHEALATVYLLFHQSGLDGSGEDIDSLDMAMCHRKAAVGVITAGFLPRLQASLRWVHEAGQHSHGTELEAYATCMKLLDAYISTTASVSSRHEVVKIFPSPLAVNAASCALRSGDVGRAVELLEQGRTIVWTQMTRLRTPLGSLPTRGDYAVTLMKRFRDLSSLLDRPPVNHVDGAQSVDVEAEATRYRRLVTDWNGVVEEIRKIEGFSRFLLPPLFADLQEAARDGPIIMLVASKSSCDAIIISYQQPPTSIQLPTNFEKLAKLVLAFREAIGKDASPKGNQIALIKALRKLWGEVVRPVVQNLGGFVPRGSRIWFCPTSLFNFLPLHAAGEYRANGESLSQRYISSYTPSLTALMRARRSHDRSLSVPFAAIGQNCPAGHASESTLEFVEPELELVRSLLPPPPTVSFTKITSVDATKTRALCALRDNTWLHFACHGTQKLDEPFNSAFLMRDHPISLLDITQLDLSRHEFAFLSACETAVGDVSTPDEVIHLAAGLQFAGVKSVVGTLWKVNDSTVQRIVEAFYKKLCGDGKMNPKRAAQALHQAVHSLARDKDMPLDQRIVFIHIGI